ncbi:hypothetical protein, partial [Pseudoalteromonas sp. MMG012]|uniref:hypothetical protein n=1 Tax=Pseudoalteromonas sp. MMG012 TaxID=2822686 RepID=UPI001B3A0CD1
NNTKVKTINYTISLSDITLTKLKNPVHAILSGGSDTGAANEFIYGVYSAKIKYGISFYDEYAKEITLGAGFETDLFSAETNVKKSSSSQISSKYKFESVAPVQIGFLKRNIASINRIPTSLKLALDPNNANLINITWKAVENASYYNIFQSETAGINANSTSTYSQKITVEDPFYTFEGAPNQSYYFKVSSTVNRQESETGLEDGIQTIPGDETPPGDGPIDGGGNSKQPEVEPNNDINSAQEIRAGVVSGQKTTAQDYNDVFKLIPSKTALDFKVIHEKQYSATSDYDIYIYNHNEELIHSFPSYNGENDQHIIGVKKNKPVYIKMNMKNDTTINDRYNLELGFLNYNYELEPNNALSDANLLLNNTTKRGSRSFRSDYRDYYYINTESNTLRVKFTHSDKLSASSNYTIYIYNATEEQISKVKAENGMDVDFNIGVELNSRIYIRVDIDGDNARDI